MKYKNYIVVLSLVLGMVNAWEIEINGLEYNNNSFFLNASYNLSLIDEFYPKYLICNSTSGFIVFNDSYHTSKAINNEILKKYILDNYSYFLTTGNFYYLYGLNLTNSSFGEKIDKKELKCEDLQKNKVLCFNNNIYSFPFEEKLDIGNVILNKNTFAKIENNMFEIYNYDGNLIKTFEIKNIQTVQPYEDKYYIYNGSLLEVSDQVKILNKTFVNNFVALDYNNDNDVDILFCKNNKITALNQSFSESINCEEDDRMQYVKINYEGFVLFKNSYEEIYLFGGSLEKVNVTESADIILDLNQDNKVDAINCVNFTYYLTDNNEIIKTLNIGNTYSYCNVYENFVNFDDKIYEINYTNGFITKTLNNLAKIEISTNSTNTSIEYINLNNEEKIKYDENFFDRLWNIRKINIYIDVQPISKSKFSIFYYPLNDQFANYSCVQGEYYTNISSNCTYTITYLKVRNDQVLENSFWSSSACKIYTNKTHKLNIETSLNLSLYPKIEYINSSTFFNFTKNVNYTLFTKIKDFYGKIKKIFVNGANTWIINNTAFIVRFNENKTNVNFTICNPSYCSSIEKNIKIYSDQDPKFNYSVNTLYDYENTPLLINLSVENDAIIKELCYNDSSETCLNYNKKMIYYEFNKTYEGNKAIRNIKFIALDISNFTKSIIIKFKRVEPKNISIKFKWLNAIDINNAEKIKYEIKNNEFDFEENHYLDKLDSKTLSKTIKVPNDKLEQNIRFYKNNKLFMKIKYEDDTRDVQGYITTIGNNKDLIYAINLSRSDIDQVFLKYNLDVNTSQKIGLRICDKYDIINKKCIGSWSGILEEGSLGNGEEDFTVYIDQLNRELHFTEGVAFRGIVIDIPEETSTKVTASTTRATNNIAITGVTSAKINLKECKTLKYIIENKGEETEITKIELGGFNENFLKAKIIEPSIPYKINKDENVELKISFCPQMQGIWDVNLCVYTNTTKKCTKTTITTNSESNIIQNENEEINKTIEENKTHIYKLEYEFNKKLIIKVYKDNEPLKLGKVEITYPNLNKSFNYTTDYEGKIEINALDNNVEVKVFDNKLVLRRKINLNIKNEIKEEDKKFNLNIGRIATSITIIIILILIGVVLDARII